MITRAYWRRNEVWCPGCRLYRDEVQRFYDDRGDFLEDKCLECDTKLPHPRRKPGNIYREEEDKCSL